MSRGTRSGKAPGRCDWGPTGAEAIAAGAEVAVVVDVLSFRQCCVERSQAPGAADLPVRAMAADLAAPPSRSSSVLRARRVGRLLTRALPPWLVVRGDDHLGRVVALMGREIALDAPGQGSLLDRLLDVVLVSAIRSYATETPGRPGSWLTTRYPLVTAALELLHDDPARGWTLDSLARAVRGSRATLSRRFAAEVGEPPMGHLTRLRLALAADLLSDPEATVAWYPAAWATERHSPSARRSNGSSEPARGTSEPPPTT